MDQALINQIVSNVLAQLQPVPVRPAIEQLPQPKPATAQVTASVITADLLSELQLPGKSITIGSKSILTPSARDWLNSKKMTWSRAGLKSAASTVGSTGVAGAKWQVIVHTVTPTVQALYDGLKRQSEGWKVELVGQWTEAAKLAAAAVSTAERDGVVVLSEYAEVIACRSNRNERVRAAVISDRKQLELTRQHLGVNLVCINPHGRTFIELRNLLRDCAAAKPAAPAGWNE